MFQLTEKCRFHAEGEEKARKLYAEIHTKLNSQLELVRELDERLRKNNEEEISFQEKIEQLCAQNMQERENSRRAQQRLNVFLYDNFSILVLLYFFLLTPRKKICWDRF